MIMKRILFFLISSLFWIAGELQAQTDSYVEVLYFHGKQRCITCKSIEKYTREVVEGEELANAYQVSWSSLYINQWKDGKEQRNDMTRLGFQYAKNKTDHFKQEIRKKINQLL